MHPEARIQAISAQQGGVITRAQVLAAGLTDRQIAYRVATARWSRMAHGGYRTLDMPGRRHLLHAAVAVLPGAVASHTSAAAIHGLRHIDTRTVSVTVHASTTHDFPGVEVHRTRDLLDAHHASIDGVPTTSVARCIVDLAAVTHPRQLHVVLSDAIASRKTTAVEVDGVLSQVARRGKPGVAALRRELSMWVGSPVDASALERAGVRLLEDADITGWTREPEIPWDRNRRFDVGFAKQRVAIEWDSRRWHTLGEAFASDRRRDAEALAHGWRIIRFTWQDVHDRSAYVVDTILTVLAIAG